METRDTKAVTFAIATTVTKATRADARYLSTDPLFSTYWTPERDRELAYLGELHHLAGAARVMRLATQRVAARAKLLGLNILTQEQAATPTKGEWIYAATLEAIASCVAPVHILRGSRRRDHVHARWRAWRRLLNENPAYSVKGLSRVCGHDHTSILNGLWRLRKLEAGLARGRK